MARSKPQNQTRRVSLIKNRARTTWLASIGFLGFVMLFSHQNCAPAGSAIASASRNTAGIDSPVSIIDESKSAVAVSFQTKSVELHAQANEVSLSGVCGQNQEGSVLAWHANAVEVDGSEGVEFARGFADCSSGAFNVSLAPTQELACGLKYQVSARLGLGAPAQLVLTRRCAPQNISDGAAFKAAVVPQASSASCIIEKSAANSCSVVCYSDDGVVQGEKPLDPNSCQI